MELWIADLEFERQGPIRGLLKAAVVNPLANYLPASMLRGLLRVTKSELAAANWTDPGGWRSMVISYKGDCRQIADKILIGGGTLAKALRNRKKLATRILARLIDNAEKNSVHVLCLGAGPGHVITDALCQTDSEATATLVDISSDAFEYGRELARQKGVAEKVEFIEGDVREVGQALTRPPDVVKMLGICEYLTDEQIVDIATAVAAVMPSGSPIVFNSLCKAHGNDRFFRRVFGLHMNHRSPRELEDLMARAGFGDYVELAEPLGVYQVIVGRKKE